jgi:hypothetical protein
MNSFDRGALCGALAITLIIIAASFGKLPAAHAQKPEPKGSLVFTKPRLLVEPEFWKQIEQHCIAVLTEAHEEPEPTGSLMPTIPMYSRHLDKNGNMVRDVAEQTLKLRCQ